MLLNVGDGAGKAKTKLGGERLTRRVQRVWYDNGFSNPFGARDRSQGPARLRVLHAPLQSHHYPPSLNTAWWRDHQRTPSQTLWPKNGVTATLLNAQHLVL